jgi:hypothetical protein
MAPIAPQNGLQSVAFLDIRDVDAAISAIAAIMRRARLDAEHCAAAAAWVVEVEGEVGQRVGSLPGRGR